MTCTCWSENEGHDGDCNIWEGDNLSQEIPPLMKRLLQQKFDDVPRQVTVVYEWSSPQGKAFWQAVEQAVDEGGMDLDRIGILLGLSHINTRYKAQGKRKK